MLKRTTQTTLSAKLARTEVLLFAAVLVIGSLYAWYVYELGFTLFLVDQNAHLNISRLIIDSLTPGISQIGFWPPLLHILMIPFSFIDVLYQSGLAAPFALVPVLGVGALFLYKLLFLFTKRKAAGVLGAFLFVSNPYVLYYSVTPMTEALFISSLFIVAYFLAHWLVTEQFSSLLYLGISITLAGLARFEGFLLVPIAVVIVVLKLVLQKKHYHEIEALLILFGLIAVLGGVFTVMYGWVFTGDPFAFLNNPFSPQAQQRDYFLPSKHSIVNSFLYLLYALYHLIGKTLGLLAIGAFAALLFLLRNNRFNFIAVSLVLISPFFFDWFALFQGSALIYVPDLPPFGEFANERYGLYPFGFTVFAAGMFVYFLYERALSQRVLWPVTAIATGLIMGLLFWNSALLFYNVTYADTFKVIQMSGKGSLIPDQRELALALRGQYDYGKILLMRAMQNHITVTAQIPLKSYIVESNYPYFDEALELPWFFARWVVMYNPDIAVVEWRKENERISARWANSDEFREAYELVFENESERLYRLREDVVRKKAAMIGMDASTIPSLNPDMVRWETRTVYAEITGKLRVYYEGIMVKADEAKTLGFEMQTDEDAEDN
ncbi:MAG: hypothetical protein A3C80_00235 [Candidatus Ryanbacteria bacterium RIFCSPHIGHO2_02_FULL_45_43]|uniref:Glycosyltransferase RgtA/B/C/D-like domain-containing protein n=1 Tax=Candidatus Ryanbacteria bacterium RIFCSPHIGHO2_01_45_13 TaxID=1802112 RepID=A0A1G2G0Z3_9BACT|nr:MAG: hypothetical protein A2718_01620 [Candidatus Ryanbacteria bacterium RIFCSPHIGHO2_01_FULL_44_130]OGZ43767.1 MAG: hypothetical protein A2W41_04740 [Candidatus Ryanbacteria bacterium RIFCSPHIGHO2_01_45_13]OGZ47709.1 MAG: hypothetical protein A3C80_00235 [Candidatus Ryanbacteria bacterium RIFCSPHIGHO2_02_FULL_45_43]OGZ49605.1 MAG: hypothetical protein A3E55_04235 [Candidatus Ryanbacteria bacterium RIFCSPHIGHO2_12_FULL_44_20]OGZ51287.1 MAG: hypothetical protein A3A17_04560 [Candidatus Ryanba